ncbi:hypothetical protein [Pseudomonas arsenicoxydans]|uniref:Uncharacterized protein n=1 Tax=Pseudomonas arsenicoxydans TaxID=702115 RepID=A0A4P6G4L5_9PSED|nr:hypothetical protein [Pseudomonas arsenicoxydans]QAY85076.1 hypothetical protein CUN61_14200 [Pseudomonas arsenicoxydans]
MTVETVPILIEDKLKIAVLDCDEDTPSIQITLESGRTQKFSGLDIYECLGKIIKSFPEIKFLCKGAKINVRPSSMSSQMSCGIMAYEHKLGVRASRKDLVNIFQYDDQDIIHDPQMQTDFFHRWLESIKK